MRKKIFSYLFVYLLSAFHVAGQPPVDPNTGKEIYKDKHGSKANDKEVKPKDSNQLPKSDPKTQKSSNKSEPQKEAVHVITTPKLPNGVDEIYIDPIEDFQRIHFHYKGSEESELLGDSVILGMKLEKHTNYILQIRQEEYIHPDAKTNAIRYILVKQIFPETTFSVSNPATPIDVYPVDESIILNIDYRLDDNNMLRIKQSGDESYIAYNGSIFGFDYYENHLYIIKVEKVGSDYKLNKIESDKYVGVIIPEPKNKSFPKFLEYDDPSTVQSVTNIYSTNTVNISVDYLTVNNHILIRKENEGKYSEFFWSIFGFTYTEGHSYKLEVEKYGMNYKLVKVRNETKQDFFNPSSYQVIHFPINEYGKKEIEIHYNNNGFVPSNYKDENRENNQESFQNNVNTKVNFTPSQTNPDKKSTTIDIIPQEQNTQTIENPLSKLKPKEIINDKEEEAIYERTDENPVFPGGNVELMRFIENNLVYTDEIINNKIEGKITVKFIIDKEGSINNPIVVKDISGCASCSDEAKRVCYKMPKWSPGMKNGQAVKSYYYLQIFFRKKE